MRKSPRRQKKVQKQKMQRKGSRNGGIATAVEEEKMEKGRKSRRCRKRKEARTAKKVEEMIEEKKQTELKRPGERFCPATAEFVDKASD